MATIDPTENTVYAVFRQAASRYARTGDQETAETSKADVGRSVHDTVTLSEGGQKVVNLARGTTLSAEIKNTAVDENFAAKLKDATDDVFRINDLFRGTVRAAFAWWK